MHLNFLTEVTLLCMKVEMFLSNHRAFFVQDVKSQCGILSPYILSVANILRHIAHCGLGHTICLFTFSCLYFGFDL